MLKEFRVTNFMSFNEEQSFTLNAGKIRKNPERVKKVKANKLVKCKMIYGANASGKSNFVKALDFMKYVVCTSMPSRIAHLYFRQERANQDKPSIFEVTFYTQLEKPITYGFSVSLKEQVILKEWCYETTVTGIKKYLFSRDTSDVTFTIGDYFKDKDSIIKLNFYGNDTAAEQQKLFLHIITENKLKMFKDCPELSILYEVFNFFRIKLVTRVQSLSKYNQFSYHNYNDLFALSDKLSALGTGIKGIKKESISRENVLLMLPRDMVNDIYNELYEANSKAKEEDSQAPIVIARTAKEFIEFKADSENNVTIEKVKFVHENEEVLFDYMEESDGTLRMIDLIDIIFNGNDSRIFVIDEIDRCLHPLLTSTLIQSYLELAKTRDCQLIATTHESRLLTEGLLRNDEFTFLIKNETGASIINDTDTLNLRTDKTNSNVMYDSNFAASPRIKPTKLIDANNSEQLTLF